MNLDSRVGLRPLFLAFLAVFVFDLGFGQGALNASTPAPLDEREPDRLALQ